jgi:hypothetical protein
MTEKLTDARYEETLARIADENIDLGGTIGLRRWCDGSGPCAVETEPHGHNSVDERVAALLAMFPKEKP